MSIPTALAAQLALGPARWGTVGEWALTVFTLGALVWAVNETRRSRNATVEATRESLTLIEMQGERDRREAERVDRTQASSVSCWVSKEWTPEPADPVYNDVEPDDLPQRTVLANNYSSAMVYDVRSFVMDISQGSFVLHPDPQHLPPGGSKTQHIVKTAGWDGARHVDDFVGIVFRDNSGVEWVKWANGRLERRADDLGVQLRQRQVRFVSSL